MNESLIADIWNILREYGDKKQMSVIAEKYVELLSEHGASDRDLENSLGHDDDLDDAIRLMLNIDDEDEFDHESYDYDEE